MLSHGECGHSLVTLVDRHIYIFIYEVYQNSVASPGAAPFQWSRVSVHLSCVRSIFVVLKASSLDSGADGGLGASRRGALDRSYSMLPLACLLPTPSSRFGLMPRKVSSQRIVPIAQATRHVPICLVLR